MKLFKYMSILGALVFSLQAQADFACEVPAQTQLIGLFNQLLNTGAKAYGFSFAAVEVAHGQVLSWFDMANLASAASATVLEAVVQNYESLTDKEMIEMQRLMDGFDHVVVQARSNGVKCIGLRMSNK